MRCSLLAGRSWEELSRHHDLGQLSSSPAAWVSSALGPASGPSSALPSPAAAGASTLGLPLLLPSPPVQGHLSSKLEIKHRQLLSDHGAADQTPLGCNQSPLLPSPLLPNGAPSAGTSGQT